MTEPLVGARRVVVKVGSTLVTDEGRGLDADAIQKNGVVRNVNWSICLQQSVHC